MDEEDVIKLLVFTTRNRINYLERKYGPDMSEIPKEEVACLRDCLVWLFERAMERKMNLDFR